MKLAASLLACAALLAGAADASAAKKEKDKARKEAPAAAKPALVGSYGDWKVYHSASGKTKICYLLSQPKKRDPDDANREQAYAFISERPSEHVRNEISFVMGTDLIAVGGRKEEAEKAEEGRRRRAAPTVVGRRRRVRPCAQGQRSLDQEPGRGEQGDRRDAQGRQPRHQGRRAQGRPGHRHLFAVGLQSSCGQSVERLPGKLIAGFADEILNLGDLA